MVGDKVSRSRKDRALKIKEREGRKKVRKEGKKGERKECRKEKGKEEWEKGRVGPRGKK